MWSALSSHARHLLDVRSNLNASATVSECRHGAIQPGHDVGGRQSGALLSCAATISGAGARWWGAISTGGISLQRCVDQQHDSSAMSCERLCALQCTGSATVLSGSSIVVPTDGSPANAFHARRTVRQSTEIDYGLTLKSATPSPFLVDVTRNNCGSFARGGSRSGAKHSSTERRLVRSPGSSEASAASTWATRGRRVRIPSWWLAPWRVF